jgi:hypothetical protein
MPSSSITLNVRLKWPGTKDHYAVWFEDHDIGRILLARDVSETAWEWSIVLPMQLAAWTRGSADNRDGAIRDFSSAWGRALGSSIGRHNHACRRKKPRLQLGLNLAAAGTAKFGRSMPIDQISASQVFAGILQRLAQ